MTHADLDFGHYGTTRSLSALDLVTLRYTSFPKIPTIAEFTNLAESNPTFREEVLALPADSQDTALCRAKLMCSVLSARAAGINAMEEIR